MYKPTIALVVYLKNVSAQKTKIVVVGFSIKFLLSYLGCEFWHSHISRQSKKIFLI